MRWSARSNVGCREHLIDGSPGFFGTPERPKEVMRALKGRGIRWQAGVTSKLAQDDRMLELAAESGCFMLSIGFESISRGTLKSVHKHVNQPETFAALVEKLHSYGIMVFGLFMFVATAIVLRSSTRPWPSTSRLSMTPAPIPRSRLILGRSPGMS